MRTVEQRESRKKEVMESCFDCFCKNGLNNTNMRQLAAASGMSSGNLYVYFENIDRLILESTEYCMTKVEDEFMTKATACLDDLNNFLHELPRWTAEKHGEAYRFMYQVYTSPKYYQYGTNFVKSTEERYRVYAKLLAPQLNIPEDKLVGLMHVFIRACVHFAMFRDETYLDAQLEVLRSWYRQYNQLKNM